MCQRAETVIVLADSCKFDNIGVTPVVELSQISMIITDKDISKEKVEILESYNIKTVVV